MGALISRQGKFNCSIYFMIFDLNLVLTICFTLEDIFFMYNVILINFRTFAVLYREVNFVLKKIDQVHIYNVYIRIHSNYLPGSGSECNDILFSYIFKYFTVLMNL